MSLIVNTNMRNDTDGYLTDAKFVKGTYVIVSGIDHDVKEELPSGTKVKGTIVYDANVDKEYRWNGTNWVEEKTGGSGSSDVEVVELAFTSESPTSSMQLDANRLIDEISVSIETIPTSFDEDTAVFNLHIGSELVLDMNNIDFSEKNVAVFNVRYQFDAIKTMILTMENLPGITGKIYVKYVN